MICPICHKRPAKRFCPAKGEKICEVCCGREREVTINCPSTCPYLVRARQYEREHRKPLSPDQIPYPNVEFSVNYVYEHWPVVAGIAGTILAFHVEHRDLNDASAVAALEAAAETYRTMTSGIYYERPPEASLPRALYAQIIGFVSEARKQEARRLGGRTLHDSDFLNLLVFLLRLAKAESNGRPLTRGFLDFLRSKVVPNELAAAQEAPRIIVP